MVGYILWLVGLYNKVTKKAYTSVSPKEYGGSWAIWTLDHRIKSSIFHFTFNSLKLPNTIYYNDCI